MSKSNQIQLSDHFTTGRLLKFTASPIIMMIFTSIYTIVDGFFVSNCAGKTAFTALNLIYPYLQMLGCLGFMIGTGGSALVAMTLGMGDEKRANRLFSMLAVATVGIGAIFSAIGLALLRPVALLLGATPELLPSCLLYGRILLTFQTAFMLQYLFQSFFIAAEKPKLGLFFTVAAGATNMVLTSCSSAWRVLGWPVRRRRRSSARWSAVWRPFSTLLSAVPAAACISQSRCSACESCSKPAPTASAS